MADGWTTERGLPSVEQMIADMNKAEWESYVEGQRRKQEQAALDDTTDDDPVEPQEEEPCR